MSNLSSDISSLELFRLELEERVVDLNRSLLALETSPRAGTDLDLFMRAIHSVKGAAAILGLTSLVGVAHRLEDGFAVVKAGEGELSLELIQLGFRTIDRLETISRLNAGEILGWLADHEEDLKSLGEALEPMRPPSAIVGSVVATPSEASTAPGERVVRVEAESLHRIMGLSGELLVEARWLQPFADSLALLREKQRNLQATIEALSLQITDAAPKAQHDLVERARQQQRECRDTLAERLSELELYALRTTNLSDRLYREVIGSNMRPFADALVAMPRMVRDLALALDKQVEMEVVGSTTLVDRDILRRLESPLIHMLRNAVDHGIEPAAERQARGKPARGLIRIEAFHRGGMLAITISDDGAGVREDAVRARLVEIGHCSLARAQELSSSDLYGALQQPGFSTAPAVTEVSGRGVGLDVVRSMVQEVSGTLRISSQPQVGTTIHLQLPLTLSVVRTLLVEIAGEPYAFPLARLDQILAIEPDLIQRIEGREFFLLDGVAIGLITARQVLDLPEASAATHLLPVVVISHHDRVYGVVVDRYLGEQDLVVRPLDPRLGKVANVSAAALMGDGQPILIIDTVDLVRSIDDLLKQAQPLRRSVAVTGIPAKRVLIVDDSPVIINLLTRLVCSAGYEVEQAADGAEALATLRARPCDLLITDVEMPVMDGTELIRRLRQDPRYLHLPVVISSSRESEQDRLLGLEVGADYYLGKSDFQNEVLQQVLYQLIGPPIPQEAERTGSYP